MTTDDSHDHVRRQAPPRVASSTRVNLAFPLSQIKIEEPGDHLVALAALVEELADVMARAVPGPETKALRRRAHELASQVR